MDDIGQHGLRPSNERVDLSVPIGETTELEPAAAPRPGIAKLSYFNDFPYLTTGLASALYHSGKTWHHGGIVALVHRC